MAKGKGHKKGCSCGFCRKSHLFSGKGGKRRGKKRGS